VEGGERCDAFIAIPPVADHAKGNQREEEYGHDRSEDRG
jgi:hypothetical protein